MKDLRQEMVQIKTEYVTYKTARQRAKFINWQISELGMTCGDAISIANAAYDMVKPTVNTEHEEYTTDQLDSIIDISSAKAYAIRWANVNLARKHESKEQDQ